jgi:hypothetical protein
MQCVHDIRPENDKIKTGRPSLQDLVYIIHVVLHLAQLSLTTDPYVCGQELDLTVSPYK